MLGRLKRKLTRENLRAFLKEQATEKSTLDIGSGRTDYSEWFPNRVGIDLACGKSTNLLSDAHQLPFSDGSFDTILCTEVLEHLKEPKAAITEMKRVLKKEGKVVLTTCFVYPLHESPNDYFRFTKFGLTELFKEWDIEVLRPAAGTIESLAVLIQRVALQCDLRYGTRYLFLLLAHILSKASFILHREYGAYNSDRDAMESSSEDSILAYGYYLVAKNR